MKKLILAIILGLTFCAAAWAGSIKLTTTTSATADKVGDNDRNGLLFKFDLPAELQDAQIDLAYLRFKVETDSTRPALGLLVRPMMASWNSGQRISSLPESTASPVHVNFGVVSLKNGAGKVEITQTVKAWQKGELSNLGFLVYPAETEAAALRPVTLPAGGAAELEILYTGPEKK